MDKQDEQAVRSAMGLTDPPKELAVNGFLRVELIAPAGYRAGIVRDEKGLLVLTVSEPDGKWPYNIRPMDGTVHRLSKKNNALIVQAEPTVDVPEDEQGELPDTASLRKMAKAAYLKALADIREIEAGVPDANGQPEANGMHLPQ